MSNKPATPDHGSDQSFRRSIGATDLQERNRRRMAAVQSELEEAVARGDFDDLPGKGKPLAWDTARDDEHWLANHVLKNAGYTPSWIEDAKRIDAERSALQASIDSHRQWRRSEQRRVDGDLDRGAEKSSAGRELDQSLDQFCAQYRERALALNRLIDSFNLEVPIETQQRRRVNIEAQLSDLRRALSTDASSRVLDPDKA